MYVGNVVAGDQRLRHSFHHKLQGHSGNGRLICRKQRHALGVDKPGGRGLVHLAHSVFPTPLRHQDGYAHGHVCLGVAIRILRIGQSSVPRRYAVHTLMHCIRCCV